MALNFWSPSFWQISAFWALSFLLPFALQFGFDQALYEVLHTVLLDYIPFIILLLALFTVAGGVRMTGSLRGRRGQYGPAVSREP